MSPNLIHQITPSISYEENQSTKSTTILADFGLSTIEKPDGKIKVRTLCLLGALLPGLGCYFVIGYTYLFQYDRVLNFSSSHCPNVTSPFPPVSYSIGVWEPQKFMWLLILSFHLPPRLFLNVVYIRQYRLGHSESQKEAWFRRMIWFHMRMMFLEAFGLLSVSIIDIESDFLLHAFCYAIWLISFNFNMLFNTILHHYSGFRNLHDRHDVTFQIKRLMFIFGVIVSISSGFFYISYVYLCNNIAYALFSVAECILVGMNSGFYFILVFEMRDARVEMVVSKMKFSITEAK